MFCRNCGYPKDPSKDCRKDCKPTIGLRYCEDCRGVNGEHRDFCPSLNPQEQEKADEGVRPPQV